LGLPELNPGIELARFLTGAIEQMYLVLH